ncbi:MAG TPA: porin [Rudaea sp.]|nr:porin [Rudaea sp.]
MQLVPLERATLALVLCLALSPAARADEAALKSEIDALRAEVAALQAAVKQMQAGQAQVAAAPAQAAAANAAAAPPTAAASASTPPAVAASPAVAATGTGDGALAGTNLWGYGELNYNHPTGNAGDTQADLRRAVIGFSHAFDESTRVYGEIEWEHAVVSADDQGETEIEQLYVEHSLAGNYGVRAGLMLIPLGLLNEHHEPAYYYGVERNFVETAIIPTTWREGGVAMYGNTDSGLSWNVGVGTGPDLGKWDPSSDEGRASPLGSIHQELQLAKAHDLSGFGALNWQGVPGLLAGVGVFAGKIGQDTPDFPADNARLVLGEAHVRWQPGPFDLSALYARGTISDTQSLNLSYLGQPTPVPKAFWGGYAQGAWRALEWGRSSLVPFARYEEFNTGAAYAEQPPGFGMPALPTQRVWTAGANYYLNPNVVFKVDYQHFNYDDEALGYGNRFDLGLGYQF